jgi:hypothetical protein
MKKEDNESATLLTVVFMDLAMSGNPGRYMSIVKGTIAVSSPSNKIVINLFLLFMTSLCFPGSAFLMKVKEIITDCSLWDKRLRYHVTLF